MKEWVLLKHSINNAHKTEIHFDFLLENEYDCLTWKIYELPKIDGSPVNIFQQANHRLIWLERTNYVLSDGRGAVQRIDHGQYDLIENVFNEDSFRLTLNGKLLFGVFQKKGNICQILSQNNIKDLNYS